MNIIIVDDDPFVTGALKTILESTGEITVKATGTDGKEACELYEKYQPDVLLMDEPTSALDPISTSKIEELASELKSQYTIVMVTHNMQQAVRISDYTAFFLLGDLIEYGETQKIFEQPKDKRTEDYITGRFG